MSGPLPQGTTSGPGKAFLIGGTAVAAGFGGFYMNMFRKKHKEEARGSNPTWEQTINHAYQSNMKPNQADALRPPMHAHASDLPPAFRRDEHFSGHSTYANYKDTPAYAEHGEEVRRMVPTPQRQHTDGTGRVYTKSPDYAQNYGKTKRPAAKQIIDGA